MMTIRDYRATSTLDMDMDRAGTCSACLVRPWMFYSATNNSGGCASKALTIWVLRAFCGRVFRWPCLASDEPNDRR